MTVLSGFPVVKISQMALHQIRKDGDVTDRIPYAVKAQVSPDAEVLAWLVRLDKFQGPTHAHREAQVSLIFSKIAGTLSRETRRGSMSDRPVTSGCVMYFPPNESHCVQWNGLTELLNVYWTEETLRELADQSGCRFPFDGAGLQVDPAIQAIGQLLRDDFAWTGDLSAMMVDHGRALIAARMFQTFSSKTRQAAVGLLSTERLRNAVEAITASPDQAFTLVELARLCHSSVFHFSRSFTARQGCAPFEFQRRLRVEKAQILLEQTDLSVEQVGQAIGMSSPTSFSRLFRRATGQSPRAYRKMQPSR